MTRDEFNKLWELLKQKENDPIHLKVRPEFIPLWEELPGPVEVIEQDGEFLAVKKTPRKP